MHRGVKLGAMLALGAGFTPAALVAQATAGTITGRITDAAGQPVAGAQIQVVGTTRGAATSDNGTYRISGLTAGNYTLRVLRLGFQSTTRQVAVAAGGTATADFRLAPSAVNLDQVVVTATGEQIRAREQAASVAKVSTDAVPLAATNNISNLIAGRVAGVTVVASGGTTGTGSRVRIRGANSVNLSNEPLIIIDGVRVDNSANSGSIAVGGQTVSRLNDLKPEDIESIEVLRGPAATGLYGTQAANGVFQITTKRGNVGKAQWNGFGEYGQIEDIQTYPGNYRGWGKNPTTGAAITAQLGCTLQASLPGGTCARDSVTAVSQLNTPGVSPFRTGGRDRVGGSVRGGSEVARYFISTDIERERGVFETSNLLRRNFRLNADATPTQKLTVGVTSGYLSSNLQLPVNDNSNLGLVSNGLLGGSIFCSQATPCGADTTSRGYFSGFRPSQLNALETRQLVERFTGAVNANYRPYSWLSIIGQAGMDVNNRDDQSILPPNIIGTSALNLEGSRTRNRFTIGTYTANLSGQASFNPFRDLSSQTTLGVQYNRDNFSGNLASGGRLLAGTGSLAGVSARQTVDEQNVYTRLFGVIVQQQFGFKDRLFVTGSVRGDRNSSFGQNLGTAWFPSAQLSYVISDERWFPKSDIISQVKLRSAIGQAGLRPGVTDALLFYTPVAVTVANNSVSGFTVGGAGNPNLKPERITEAEGGFDIGLFNGRASLEVTYFSKRSQDALISRPLAGSLGGPFGRFENIGVVTNKGVEIGSNLRLVDTRNVGFDLNLNFSTLSNKLVSLAEGITPIIYGLGGATQRHTPGAPLGAYFQVPYTFADANNNNVIEVSEVTLTPGPNNTAPAPQFLGNPLPKRSLSVLPTLTLFRNFRVNAVVDYRGGFYLYNGTEQFRCATTGTCRALYDPTASLDKQAAAIAARNYGTFAGYMEKADFIRLRELALTVQLPQRYAQRLRARGMNLTLAGQNLALWSKYSGLDPELNFAGQSNQTYADFLTQPPVRRLTVRANLDF